MPSNMADEIKTRGRKKAVTTIISELIADGDVDSLSEALQHPSVWSELQGAVNAAEGLKRVKLAMAEAQERCDLSDILATLEDITHKHDVRCVISVKPILDGTTTRWLPSAVDAAEAEEEAESEEPVSSVDADDSEEDETE